MTDDLNTARVQWETAGGLLARWRNRARLNQDQHWEATKHFERLNYWLGIPTIVLSGVVGTTVFATLQKQVEFRIQLLVGGISVLAAVLAGLQTFLGFSKRAEQHKAAAAEYGAIRRRLETEVTLPVELRGSLAEMVKEVKNQLDTLAKSAPTVPNRIFRSVSVRLKADPDTWPETPALRHVHPAPGALAPAASAAFTGIFSERGPVPAMQAEPQNPDKGWDEVGSAGGQRVDPNEPYQP